MIFTNPASANDERTFEGTLAEWNALSLVQKTFYTKAIINNDYTDNPVGNLNSLTTTDKSSCVGAINEVNGAIGTAIRVEKVNLSAQTVISTGLMDIQFNLPSISGYTPVGVLNYNFADRGIAQQIFISGEEITGGNTAHIYGSVTGNVTLTVNAYVMILYKKLINN